ncbi:MAG: T9SS type A sorting domain-containing protein [Parafilimonas sp.]
MLNYSVNNIKPGKIVVTIANTNGLIVYKQEFTLLDTSFNKTFNMSSLLNGVYSLQVDNGTEKRSVKFAKQ